MTFFIDLETKNMIEYIRRLIETLLSGNLFLAIHDLLRKSVINFSSEIILTKQYF